MPLLFPGQRLEPLRRQRQLAPRPDRLRRGRRRGHRAAAPAVPHPDRARHAGRVDSRRWRMLHGARPRPLRRTRLGHRLLAGRAGRRSSSHRSIGQLSHTNLTLLIVSAYAAAMIGRLRSLPMTFVGAVFLGPRRLLRHRLHPRAATPTSSTFRFVIPVVVLFVVLLVLPEPAAAHRTRPRPRGRTSRCRPGAARAGHRGRDHRRRAWCWRASSATPTRSGHRRIFGIALIALSLVPLTASAARCRCAR